ncbi:hypothetical protein ACCO45_012202 [Purpureocillium lilacinum]|uniref:Uncharacterized protein n=1 Tax=Purpureocillium lilacinum TaxID=33203 RepID=A0ACC4DDC4_PURLI
MWKRLSPLLRAPSWKRTAAINTVGIIILWAFLLSILIYGCIRTGRLESAFILYEGPAPGPIPSSTPRTLAPAGSILAFRRCATSSTSGRSSSRAGSSWLAAQFRYIFSSNSLVFEVRNVRATFGMTIAAESFVHGAKYFAPGASLWNTAVPYNCSILGLPGHEKNDKLCRQSNDDDSSIWRSEGYAPGEELIFPAMWMNESSATAANLTLAATTASNWDRLDPDACRKEFLYCGDGKGMEDYTNVVLVVNASNSPASGWSRKQVFPSMSNADSTFWKAILPEEESNSLWLHTNCVVMSTFEGGKCRNSCKSNLGLEGLTTDDIDIVDPSSNPHDTAWSFPFWSQKSLKEGILDAQMRSGFDARYDQLDVSYCLAERAPQRCQIGVSNALLMAIVVCVSVKAVNCILLMARFVSREDNHPLVTLGDAVESLLRLPDPTTARMCTLEMRDIHVTWDRILSRFRSSKGAEYSEAAEGAQLLSGEHSHRHVSPQARQWRRESSRYYLVVTVGSWLRAYAIFVTVLIVALYYFSKATGGTFRISGDFGISGKNKFVTQDQGSSDAYSGDFIRMVFLANVAQCVLSISYLNFNSVITRLSLAKEWALMGTGFRPLRVTDPEGEQVSTHFLGLPYSWSVPCIALGILLHWLVSNSCYVFMTDGGFYGSWTRSPTMRDNSLGLSDFGFVGLGYSTTAIMVSIIVFAVAICFPLVLSARKLPGNMVIVGSNSLAIAASCHASAASTAGRRGPSATEHEVTRETTGLMSVKNGCEESLTMAVGDTHTTGNDTLTELSKSKVKWGVVKMPLEFYEQVSGDLDDIAPAPRPLAKDMLNGIQLTYKYEALFLTSIPFTKQLDKRDGHPDSAISIANCPRSQLLSTMSSLAQAIETTTKGFLKSYVDASQTKSMEALAAYLTDDCRRHVGPPAFLIARGAPPDYSMSNEEYAAEFNGMEHYQFDDHVLYDLVVDTQKLRAAARSEILVKFNSGETASRNFVWFLDFNEDGSKIVKVYQHNDVEEANKWLDGMKTRKREAANARPE